ncbi:dihydrodipicolinate synthase family protein [Pelagibius sp. CAU 1746]|uniref:dihydrodipicolinate synthase family protein n=1 Tax=Pelagibius sp. CAU 1746 TaxID=3140370 RepID=UPI00325B4F0A
MRISEETKGVYIISATPFAEDGTLDLASTDSLVDFYLRSGVHGMTILGIMGEAPKLTPEESVTFLTRVLDRAAGRLPVIVGVSNAGLDNLARLAHTAMDKGAAGVMVAPFPGLNTEAKVLSYFAQVCDALGADVPLVYQDYPQTTNAPVSVATLNTLIDRHPQMVMLKHEDSPGLAKITGLRQSAEKDGRRRISILVGNGGIHYPQELARGVDGAMTGFAFPEMLVQVYGLFTAGKQAAAEDLFDAYLPLVRHELQPGLGLALRKEVLRRRGAIASAKVRAPGPNLSAEDQAELTHLIDRLEARLSTLGLAA